MLYYSSRRVTDTLYSSALGFVVVVTAVVLRGIIHVDERVLMLVRQEVNLR